MRQVGMAVLGLMLIVALARCPKVEVHPEILSFTSPGGMGSFTITFKKGILTPADAEQWNVSCGAAWVTLSPGGVYRTER